MSTYILQKDWAYLKPGTKFTFDGGICTGNFYYAPDGIRVTQDFVENNPEWFKKEEPIQERIKVGKMSCQEGELGYGEMKWNLNFKTNKHIHYISSLITPTADDVARYESVHEKKMQ